jgi:hypothetical protein
VLYEAVASKAEIPDVIGWDGTSSILIECKMTRADFQRDAGKKSRTNPKAGMAHRRYYLCPANLLQPADIPPKWGLLWAEGTTVTVQRESRGFPQRNLLAEVQFLSKMLRRAQIRIGTRPLSEWLRGENRLEAVRDLVAGQMLVAMFGVVDAYSSVQNRLLHETSVLGQTQHFDARFLG